MLIAAIRPLGSCDGGEVWWLRKDAAGVQRPRAWAPPGAERSGVRLGVSHGEDGGSWWCGCESKYASECWKDSE